MRVKLGDVFDLQMGKTPSRNDTSFWENGNHKWVSIGDLSNYHKYVDDTKERITDKSINESGIRKVPPNTVLMSFKLSIGKTAITRESVYTNEAIMAFIPKGKYETFPDYFYYMLSSIDWLSDSNRAVMGATLNKATLSNIKVYLPPLDEQRRIAAVLDKVSDLIAKRREQIDNLDELVKARFVEMFGNEESSFNKWQIKTFEEICELITDGEHITPRRTSGGYYLLSARNVLNHSLKLDDVDYIDQTEYERISKRIKPQEKDVLISCSGTIGRCCVVPPNLKFQMVRSVALVRFKKDIEPIFAEWLLTSDYLQKQMLQAATQSSQANLFQGKIKKLKAFVPPLELQRSFVYFVNQVYKSKLTIQRSLDKMETLKKALMQEYFG